VVRAATFFVEGTGQWLGSWTPWYGFVTLPDGVRTQLPARTPDGGTEILLVAKNPAIEWPTPFIMKAPRLLRRGTQLSFVVERPSAGEIPGRHVRLTVSTY
jgi:hypothetical protein